MACPSRENCRIYQDLEWYPTLRERYCHSELRFIECERRMVRAAGGEVPPDLLPNGWTRSTSVST